MRAGIATSPRSGPARAGKGIAEREAGSQVPLCGRARQRIGQSLVERAGRQDEGRVFQRSIIECPPSQATRLGVAVLRAINQSIDPLPPHLISALTRGEAQHTHPTQFQSSPDHLGRGRAKKGSSNTGEHSSDPPPSARRPLHTLSPVRFASSRLPRVCSPTALGRLGHTSGAPRKGLMMRRGWRGTITGGRVRAVPSRAGGRGC